MKLAENLNIGPILPIWADLARIDAMQDARLAIIMTRPKQRRRRPPLGIQPADWIATRPIVPDTTPRRPRKRSAQTGSLSPMQRWKLQAGKAAAELEAEAA